MKYKRINGKMSFVWDNQKGLEFVDVDGVISIDSNNRFNGIIKDLKNNYNIFVDGKLNTDDNTLSFASISSQPITYHNFMDHTETKIADPQLWENIPVMDNCEYIEALNHFGSDMLYRFKNINEKYNYNKNQLKLNVGKDKLKLYNNVLQIREETTLEKLKELQADFLSDSKKHKHEISKKILFEINSLDELYNELYSKEKEDLLR